METGGSRLTSLAATSPPRSAADLLLVKVTGFCEQNIPFGWVLALQSLSRNCYPAPDLVLRKPIFLIILFSGGVFYSQTPVSLRGECLSGALNENCPYSMSSLSYSLCLSCLICMRYYCMIALYVVLVLPPSTCRSIVEVNSRFERSSTLLVRASLSWTQWLTLPIYYTYLSLSLSLSIYLYIYIYIYIHTYTQNIYLLGGIQMYEKASSSSRCSVGLRYWSLGSVGFWFDVFA